MVLLVLPKLVAGLSPEAGETETSAAVTSVFTSPPSVSLTSLFPGSQSCLRVWSPLFAYMFPHSMKHMCIKYVLPSPSCPS